MSAVGPDPAYALTPSGNLPRRMRVSRLMEGGAVGAAALAVAVLLILVAFTLGHGFSELSWNFITGDLPASAGANGGIGPAILGSLELALIAGAMAVSAGVLTALFLTEFASPRAAAPIRLALDLLAGLPAIVTGMFVFGLIIAQDGQSVIAGSIGIAIVMVPLVARGTFEALSRVPGSWRDAADALGISRWRTVVGIVLPGASSGIVTAAILAVALGAGETAPLLFADSIYGTTSQLNPLNAAPNLPLTIFTNMEIGIGSADKIAWGAASLLMIVILLVNIGARVWLRRGERKRGL